MPAPEVIVTNFNRNFTGVSATVANLLPVQRRRFEMRLLGRPLPNCPEPISFREALRLSSRPPEGRPFVIWHVRRNTEMREAIIARDVLRLPVRAVFTSSAQRLHSALPRFLISRMDAVIATSVKSAEFVPNVYAVVPHGVDLERFHPSPDRERSWARLGYGGRRGLAVVGRLRPSKGTDQVVDTLIETLPRHPDVTALIIGKTTIFYARYVDRLKKRVARAGLSERILFTGEIPAERMPGIYRSISVLLALPRHEPYGLTPLEAMASKTPFIATPTGNFLEFSDGNKAGLVVPEGRIDLATQHLDSLLGDSRILEAYAKAAQGRATRLYSIEGEASGIASVYERLWAEG